jgi:glycosyltransferase involved in cell wall biosynthesis
MSAPRVVHVFPAFSTGGPEVRTCTLINALGREFAHTVVSLNGDLTGQSRLVAAEDTRFVTPSAATGSFALLSLGRLIREQQGRLLITYGWGGTDALLAARLRRVRPVLHMEDGFLPDEAHSQKRARLLVRRVAFRMADGLIVPSRTLQRIAESSWHVASQAIHYLPNGIDVDRFAPSDDDARAAARAALGLPREATVVGTVGMLRPDKNHARLIRALADAGHGFNAVWLVIVGEGTCRSALESLAQSLGLASRVVFTGAVVDPSALYRAFDLFALSSDTEQMPLSVLEAMSTGLPVMSTEVGDVKDMVGEAGAGEVVPLGDDRAYSLALQSLLSDPARRRQLGDANRRRSVEQFSLTTMVRRYRDLYNHAVSA